ncbi:hypothetical protein Aab01nite_48380 [Paractinoplanes abujensis]|uniref:Putative lipid-binding transport protein (Tim44 family) n=1 Tax=Paractinoplanes abujensis TaxID=882441 RepID=A0A7W7CNU8_9ACTN|nr:DUF732 domain-containing protein [Actinoplanes abujensis]MBB4690483.1 putative lipid-binding transport protein (Tim44 family) [Actinoplanes abujensis]GID21248.1 hypothetical protein Aab01nite_48380 [Actinoplanes abujensis]
MRIWPVFSAPLVVVALLGTLTACSDPAPTAPLAPAPQGPSPDAATPSSPVAAVRVSPAPAVREEEPQAKAPTRTTTRPPQRDMTRFVAAVRERLPEVVIDRRDEEIAALGEQTCAELKRGRKNAAMVTAMTDQGLAATDARTVLRLARTAACPT